MRQTTLTINTAEVEDAFASTSDTTITPTLEIELTQSGTPKTVFQGTATIRKDLITAGSTVPGARDSYYTKSETNSLFVQNSTTGVDNESKILWDNNSIPSIVWGGRALYDSNFIAVLNYSAGLGFFGTSPTAQPANINVVSGLINVGLIANSTTYGVLPQSNETVTTLTSLNFGSVGANASASITVTVTGVAINDIVLLGLPSGLTEGLSFLGHVVTANQLHVDCINATPSSKTQSAATYRITVIGY
jgi:hypothetical protein